MAVIAHDEDAVLPDGGSEAHWCVSEERPEFRASSRVQRVRLAVRGTAEVEAAVGDDGVIGAVEGHARVPSRPGGLRSVAGSVHPAQ